MRHKKEIACTEAKGLLKRKNKMKKTIAILLVLVLAGAGLFAAPANDGAAGGFVLNGTGDDAKIATLTITTVASGTTLFGVSAETLGASITDAPYANTTAFAAKIYGNVTNDLGNITNLINNPLIGYVSGYNSTRNDVLLKIIVNPLTHSVLTGTTVPITVTVSGETPISVTGAAVETGRLTIPAATTVRGILLSKTVNVQATQANIDLAPEGTYNSTITFSLTAS